MASTVRPGSQLAPAREPTRHPSRVLTNSRRRAQGPQHSGLLLSLPRESQTLETDRHSIRAICDAGERSRVNRLIALTMLSIMGWLSFLLERPVLMFQRRFRFPIHAPIDAVHQARNF